MLDNPLRFADLQAQAPRAIRWAESVLLTAALPGLRFALGDPDPFGCRAQFAWSLLAPLLVGLRHGLGCAVASTASVCAGALAHAVWSGDSLPESAPATGLACLLIACVAGRVRDARRERAERLQRRVRQLSVLLSRERDARQVLQLSHERLAQSVGGAGQGVQASVEAAALRAAGMRRASELGRLILDVLAQHAELQCGAVFVLGPRERAVWPSPLATLGDRRRTCVGAASTWGGVAENPVVRQAVRTQRLVLVTEVDATADVLAALPLQAADARLVGVVAITYLPFAAFHSESLRRAFVLASRIAGAVDCGQWERWIDAFCTAGGPVARPAAEAVVSLRKPA